MAENFPTFRALLRGAICTRTQAQFALESGISAAHLNKMLNQEIIHRPTNSTLRKIASVARNGITLTALRDALDKDDPEHGQPAPEEKQTPTTFQEKAENTMAALSGILSGLPLPKVYDSVQAAVEDAIKALPDDPNMAELSYECLKPGKYPETGPHDYAREYAGVLLTMANRGQSAISYMVLFYTPIPAPPRQNKTGGDVILLQDISISVADIMDIYGLPQCLSEVMDKDPDKILDMPWYLDFQENQKLRERYIDKTAESEADRFFNSIFGKETPCSETVYGLGFWLQDPPPGLPRFLREHLDLVLAEYKDEPETGAKLEQQFAAIQDPGRADKLQDRIDTVLDSNRPEDFARILDEAEYGDADLTSDRGWQAAVAVIMQRQTGFPFVYKARAEVQDQFPGLSDKGCIIIPENQAEAMGIQRETLLSTICGYVNALGLTTFGDILFTGVNTLWIKPKTYVVRQEQPDAQADAIQTWPDDQDYMAFNAQSHPDGPGLYPCRLVDGRHIRLLWMPADKLPENATEGPGAWLKRHKEWTNWVEAYHPEALQPIAQNQPCAKA